MPIGYEYCPYNHNFEVKRNSCSLARCHINLGEISLVFFISRILIQKIHNYWDLRSIEKQSCDTLSTCSILGEITTLTLWNGMMKGWVFAIHSIQSSCTIANFQRIMYGHNWQNDFGSKLMIINYMHNWKTSLWYARKLIHSRRKPNDPLYRLIKHGKINDEFCYYWSL